MHKTMFHKIYQTSCNKLRLRNEINKNHIFSSAERALNSQTWPLETKNLALKKNELLSFK